MGKVWSALVKRPLRNFNIEHRAQDFLEKQDKPKPAPRHPSTKDALDRYAAENKEILEKLKLKDENLAKMLEGMVVNPERPGEIISKAQKRNHRPLPEDRSQSTNPEYGYLEPDVIPSGRCSIRQALEFLKDRPSSGAAESIAKRYNLDANNVQNVLDHFGVFHVHVPKTSSETPGKALSSGNVQALQQLIFPDQSKQKSDESIKSQGDPTTVK